MPNAKVHPVNEICIIVRGGEPEYRRVSRTRGLVADFVPYPDSESPYDLLNVQNRQLVTDWNGDWSSLPDGMYKFALKVPQSVRIDEVQNLHEMYELVANAFASRQVLMAFPRYWELLGFVMSKRTRERIFEPAYLDLMQQHAKAMEERFNRPWILVWLNFCFALRSILLVAECWRVAGFTVAIGFVLKCLPAGLKDAIRELWISLLR
jgi:hypothetical protein